MKSPEKQPREERRVDEPGPPSDNQSTDAARRVGTLTRFVDPFDMRAEPQTEEPGYGHGV